MLTTIRSGSAGPEVRVAQAQLNLALPDGVPLVIDGLFGPLTLGRVRQLQKASGAAIDGVVGPKTWGLLANVRSKSKPSRLGLVCDNGNPNNHGKANAIAAGLKQLSVTGGSSGNDAFAFGDAAPSAGAAPNSISIGGLTLFPLIGSAHEATARAIYVDSPVYDRIFFTFQKGVEGRAFTIPVACPPFVVASLPFGGSIQVLNLGPNPRTSTVIHELGHAWQSQHAASSSAYIANCLACQGAAIAANELIAKLDPSVKTDEDWPVQFPMSAYAYLPGAAFTTYGCEQIAQQIQKGEAPIRTHVTAQSAGARDNDNEKCAVATNIKIGDRRAPGVKI